MRVKSPDRWKRWRRSLLAGYLALLVCSWVWVNARGARVRPEGEIPTGAVAGASRIVAPATSAQSIDLAWLRWGPERDLPESARQLSAPVILIHGGPGRAADFSSLAPMLVGEGVRGRDIYALDMPGFGRSTRDVEDYSILADARAVVAWLEAMRIPRAHVLGWSQGGGVALHVADMLPERIASLTLLASIGMQETEGSRSYAFEHARYAAGDLLRRVVPWTVPHFGAIATAPPAFTRFFADSDQRPLSDVMGRVRVPTLVLHGRRDFLVPAWTAEVHAQAIPGARLVMLPESHFVPFWSAQAKNRAGGVLQSFWTDVEAGAVAWEPLGAAAPALVVDDADDVRRRWPPAATWIIGLPWWLIAGLLAVASARRGPSSRWTVSLGAALVMCALADYAVVLVGLVLGAWVWLGLQAWRARPPTRSSRHVESEWRERVRRGAVWAGMLAVLRIDLRVEAGCAMAAIRKPLAVAAFALAAAGALAIHRTLTLIVALLALKPILRDPYHPWGWAGVALGLLAARVVVGVADHLMTIPGRRALRAMWVRAPRFEFWPTWIVYMLLAPMFVRCAIRTRQPLAFTACNPGIENGGGFLGESKHAIMRGLARSGDPAVCATHLVEAEGAAEERAGRVAAAVEDAANGLRWPVILKPDSGYRGRSVRRIHTRQDAAEYFEMMPQNALLQPLHHGPGEIGAVWVRTAMIERAGQGERRGRLFSITLKEFSYIEGDGCRTLEELIWRHPRYRLQARVFLERLAGRRLDVPGAGERMLLAGAGNHCQGTLFRDGREFMTPELERAVDAIAAAFVGRTGECGSLDMVRFDIRFRDAGDLRAGRLDTNAIIEMNGTLGESTNIYDPEKSAAWALGVLRRQWELLYDRGAERFGEGVRPMGFGRFFAMLGRHFWTRQGSGLAD